MKVVCIVSGTGPLKEYYEQLIAELSLRHVQIKTM